ncbi:MULTISPECIES: endopeptidase La [unclassified Acidovorax]|uniref:endopeptidase La n=1 Tax=unclassified Acidovorax TaxID=2684926 RepID=UPI002882FCBC|nr:MULTISPECIES: endopeptidase La [unclassified Acidovorax]
MSGHTPLPSSPLDLPLLPLRDVVVFPHMVIPLFVGRPKSIKALELAMDGDRRIMLVAQKAAAKDEPLVSDMFDVGCVSTILQMLKLPDGTVKVLVEGQQRAAVASIEDAETHFTATVNPVEATDDGHKPSEIEALRRAVMQQFDQYVKLNKKIPPEILTSISSIDDPGRLADTIAAHLPLKLENKQVVLDLSDIKLRLENLFEQLDREVDILNVDKKIRGRVKRQMEKNQRDFYLNEQVKAIQKELGEGEEGADIEEIEKKIKAAKMPADARKKADSELKKLKLMSPMSAEATVVRNYIEVLTGLPWSKKTKIKHDLLNAEEVLNEDHYGLDKVKDRILEYLAVQQRVDKVKAPILCLVGPPGVGKTSLGQSIAKATGRKYVRMALGGMRDEAEIRGHRRTYIGAMPGKVLQSLNKVGTRNPLFLLDEIDKLGTDFRGDPSSALLEVLDPEQNHKFGDHYVEVDFDLSDVMFVATSNSMNIPPALLDRMEVIRLSGYTEDEKTNIAMKYLLPKQLTNNGVKDEELRVTEDAVRDIVRYYTREAGVRSLERELSKICRKVVKGLQLKQLKPQVVVTADNLPDYLGVRKYTYGRAEEQNQVGQVVGLAWTEVGGDLLTIEAATMPGKGVITRTGSLGDVMKESVEAARTVVRSRSRMLGIRDDAFEKRDVHIHVPDGATPKDGPSAGAAMATAFVSALTGIPVRGDVAMTGEITLRGEVTAIGGLKEKLLAALRGGIKTVLIPEENVKDLQEIPDNVKSALEIVPVRWIDKVLEIALERKPIALTDEEVAAAAVPAPASADKAQSTTGSVKH